MALPEDSNAIFFVRVFRVECTFRFKFLTNCHEIMYISFWEL